VPAWETLSDKDKKTEDLRMATFAGMVDRVDQNVGRLLKHLDKLSVADDTLILFLSDNGACPFQRSKRTHLQPWDPDSYWTYDKKWAHACNTPFRWYKQNQHEGGIATPLIAHWPNGLKTRPGALTHQPGHLVDIMATCLDVAGSDYPKAFGGRALKPLRGKSLLPILQGRPRRGHDALYFQFSNNRAVRKGKWKLVSARGRPWELYDLDADRTELNDLVEDQPKLAKELAALWDQWAKDVGLGRGRRKGGRKNPRQPGPKRKNAPPAL